MLINLDNFIITTRAGKYIGWEQSEFEKALKNYGYAQCEIYRQKLLELIEVGNGLDTIKEYLESSKFV